MSKPYDATAKDLIEADPAGWVAFLGCPAPPGAVRLVDADLSTVTTDADKVILVTHPAPWILHLEVQANRDDSIPRRYLQYNALLQHRHQLPVATVVILLRPSGELTGRWAVRPPIGPSWEFAYSTIRVWERPVADFLGGPLGVLPLAPLADVRPPDLQEVVGRMKDRLDREADRPLAAKLWTATYLLMGLRYQQAVADTILSGVMQMEESVTYQAIIRRGLEDGLRQGLQQGIQQGLQQGLDMGHIEEARVLLVRLGRKKLGPPTAAHQATVNAIADIARLELLLEKLLDVSTWDDLLKPD
ncbi:MAG: hypothetical protein JWO38_4854 [Gemmataceae bacterium]|nr:hypothetical protein [Gemmataceae bacterium]